MVAQVNRTTGRVMIFTTLTLLLAATSPVAAAQPPVVPSAPPKSAPEIAPPAPPAADIGYLSAGTLVDRCSETSSASTSYCFAYIAGVSDAMRAYEIWLNTREFCPPAGQSQSDLRRAFVGFVSAYPSNRTGQAASVVVVSLKQTFPCGPDPVAPAPAPPVSTPDR